MRLPGVALSGGPLTLDRRGVAQVSVRCNSAAGRCDGALRIVGLGPDLERARLADARCWMSLRPARVNRSATVAVAPRATE
jgi:hypothetical protein